MTHVTIRGKHTEVPWHNGQPFFSGPMDVFYEVTDDGRKFCFGCHKFIKVMDFFLAVAADFYADNIPNGRNVSHCLKCQVRVPKSVRLMSVSDSWLVFNARQRKWWAT